MLCSNCKTENPAGKKFCGDCGAALANLCPKCGAENQESSRFCGDCGARLPGNIPPAAKSRKAAPTPLDVRVAAEQRALPSPSDGERKTITVLFADIKGSMSQIEDLDPEEARAIFDPALAIMAEAVNRYQGYVAQSTGDGVFALFGAPIAHEDHPQRAIYAAMRMQEELRRYSDRLRAEGKAPVEIRIGINTGEVVMRSVGKDQSHAEYLPAGHAVGLASRLQTIAPTGSMALSEHTRRLVEGYFQLKSLGPTRMKGVTEAVNVYEVTGLGPLRTRLQRSASRGLSRFVGRDAEIAQMNRALERAKAGRGQVVAAVAEPGVGKSRLFFEFKAVAQSGCIVLEAFSISHGKASAYLPVIDLLHGYFKISAGDDRRSRREKMTGRVLALDRSLEDTLPYLFGLLGIVEEADPLAGMDAQIKRRRTLDAIKRMLLRESLSQPLIVVFEDLHWIDGETQALLNLLVESIGNAKILLLVNYRTEYTHQWNSKTYYTQLRLDPLGRENARDMLDAVLGDGVELAPLKRLIIDKTEGNPFFMEEMVQVMFDEGSLARNGTVKLAKSLSQLKIPPTVQAILASRIDRLPPDEKDLLQTLAVLGRQFPLALVKSVVSKSEDQLNQMLSDLQLGEFIYEQPASGDVEYMFKHALTQEVAYNSALNQRRKPLHEEIGAAIERLFKDSLDDHISQLAHHYGRSGNLRKAIEYLSREAEMAVRRSAVSEGLDCLDKAIEILQQLPDSSDRTREELKLRSQYGYLLGSVRGYGPDAIRDTFTRARELAEELGDKYQLGEAHFGLHLFHLWRAQPAHAYKHATRVLELARELNDRVALMWAHNSVGAVLNNLAEYRRSLQHLEDALKLNDRKLDRSSSTTGPAVVSALGCRAWVLFKLGYPQQALDSARDSVNLAREIGNLHSMADAQKGLSDLYLLSRQFLLAEQLCDELLRLSSEKGFSELFANATYLGGFARTERGLHELGIVQMRDGISFLQATKNEMLVIDAMGWLGLAIGKAGDTDQGMSILDDVLARAVSSGTRHFEWQVRYAIGLLNLIRSPKSLAEAEASFRTLKVTAAEQHAKSWELRATISLARVQAEQGKRDEARAMLAEIYNWFTEGFDTADLRDAKSLLEELGS
jgi:predicted ATPase/class 3 adenylate cyclase